MAVASASVSAAQSVVSTSGLRMEVHDDLQRPAIALYLPGERRLSAVIEMPEHAFRKDKADAEPAWFYKMYSSDPALKGTVTWSKRDNALSYSMTTPSGLMKG